VREAEARAQDKILEEQRRQAEQEAYLEARSLQEFEREERLQEIADKRRELRESVLLSRLQELTFSEITDLNNEKVLQQSTLRDNENMPAEVRRIQLEFISNDLEVIGTFLRNNPGLLFEDPVFLEEARRRQEERNRLSQTAKNINKVLLDAMPLTFGNGLTKVDFSGVSEGAAENWSPQNDGDKPPPYRKAATLITPQHVVLSKHWNILYGPNDPYGGKIVFVDKNGNRVTRQLVSTQALRDSDVRVGLLDSPLIM
jgi:hypothetical protein